MNKDTVIVIGGDANFYGYVEQAIKSLHRIGADRYADIAILDLGMSAHQVDALGAQGYSVVRAIWPSYVPMEGKKPYMVGYTARTELRDYFPGYRVYIWFDSDAWAQTDEFMVPMIEGAKRDGAALIKEDGPGCRRNLVYNKWLYGNMIVCYGLIDGFRASWPISFNIGIFAMSDTAPHWDRWVDHLKKSIARSGKMNMDQHAYNAMITLERLPYTHLPARHNWIATLSPPVWDESARLLCVPENNGKPLSIIHLAGPDKDRPYRLATKTGGTYTTSLTYDAMVEKLGSGALAA